VQLDPGQLVVELVQPEPVHGVIAAGVHRLVLPSHI
jgi:hypothetical protein